MASNANGTAEMAEELKAEIEQLRKDLSGLMDTVGRTAEAGRRAGAQRAREAGEKMAETASRSVETVEHQITERPFVSMLAALGAGMVIGNLLARR